MWFGGTRRNSDVDAYTKVIRGLNEMSSKLDSVPMLPVWYLVTWFSGVVETQRAHWSAQRRGRVVRGTKKGVGDGYSVR